MMCTSYDSQDIPEASIQITPAQSTGEVNTYGKPDKKKWNEFDCEFSEINKEAWTRFTHGITTPEQFATDLTGMLTSFLHSKPEFTKKVKEFFKHKEATKPTPLEQAKEAKKATLKKAKSPDATEDDRAKAGQAIRNHEYLLKMKSE